MSKNFFLISFLTCVPLVIFQPTRWIGRNYFQLNQKPLPIVTINIISAFVGIFSNIITIYFLKLGYLGWFIGSFFIGLTSFIPFLWVVVKKIKLSFDFKINKKWIKRYLVIDFLFYLIFIQHIF